MALAILIRIFVPGSEFSQFGHSPPLYTSIFILPNLPNCDTYQHFHLILQRYFSIPICNSYIHFHHLSACATSFFPFHFHFSWPIFFAFIGTIRTVRIVPLQEGTDQHPRRWRTRGHTGRLRCASEQNRPIRSAVCRRHSAQNKSVVFRCLNCVGVFCFSLFCHFCVDLRRADSLYFTRFC